MVRWLCIKRPLCVSVVTKCACGSVCIALRSDGGDGGGVGYGILEGGCAARIGWNMMENVNCRWDGTDWSCVLMKTELLHTQLTHISCSSLFYAIASGLYYSFSPLWYAPYFGPIFSDGFSFACSCTTRAFFSFWTNIYYEKIFREIRRLFLLWICGMDTQAAKFTTGEYKRFAIHNPYYSDTRICDALNNVLCVCVCLSMFEFVIEYNTLCIYLGHTRRPLIRICLRVD